MTRQLVFCMLVLSCGLGYAEDGKRRMVFNDDAQVLAEAPTTGTSAFVRNWLDRESKAVPFTTFVFLAACPDICTYDTKVGEVYGERFGPEFATAWAPPFGRCERRAPMPCNW